MSRLVFAVLLAAAGSPGFGAYTYYHTDNLTSINTANWWQNGTLTAGANGLTSADSNGGSLISKVAVPDGTSDYEVRSVLRLTQSGGSYITYFRASSDARHGPANSGSYYAFEIHNPTISGPVCNASAFMYQRVNNSLALMAAVPVACRNGMVVRVMIRQDGLLHAYIDDRFIMFGPVSGLAAGQPGTGVRGAPAGNAIQPVQLGPQDRVPPSPVAAESIAISARADRVHFQWQGSVDDPNGSGMRGYEVWRNGQWVATPLEPNWTDATVAPGTAYSYEFRAQDMHYNYASWTAVPVTTPPAAAVDPRRPGVRPSGSYWGTSGEQIDLQSGNLNFTLPLLRPQGRGGTGVTVALNYNSQNWYTDGGKHWKLGRDVGYGYGWKLLIGSLTPHWATYYTMHHYKFTDSTGAEYRLDTNVNGVWRSSQEAVHVWYDENTNRLYFPDGSFWVMGAVAGGTEQDAGTRYPTLIQDTNGNQIHVRYRWGLSAASGNSSARIEEIEDVRAVSCCAPQRWRTYRFTYNADPIPHLTGIDNYIATGEKYSFGYAASTLSSPFAPQQNFGAVSLLQSATINGLNLTHTFQYGANEAGELTKVIFPYGGELRWDYRTFTYAGNRSYREVQYRHLQRQAGGPVWQYTFTHDDATAAGDTLHNRTTVLDASGTADRVWLFHTAHPIPQVRSMVGIVLDREYPSGTVRNRVDYAYGTDAAGRPVLAWAQTTLDPWTVHEKVSKVDQTVDVYGNLVQRRVYEYGDLTTPARTYNYTYPLLSNTNYTSRFIYNRVGGATVTEGGQTRTLVLYNYDGGSLVNRTGLRQHDAAYTTSFAYRGNRRGVYRPGRGWVWTGFDITGTPASTWDDLGSSAAITPTANNAVPGTITPNSNPNGSHTLSWNVFLGLTHDYAPNFATYSTVYDQYARPTSQSGPNGSTTFTYTTAPPAVKATVSGSGWTKTYLDGFGQPVKVERGQGTSTVESVVETEYGPCACSALGKVKRVSEPYAPGGTPIWTTYNYDASGRTVSVARPNGSGTAAYVYEGNTVRAADAAGKWKKFVVNARGNLVKVVEPNPAGGEWETNYSYNGMGQLTQVVMPRPTGTQTRTFVYSTEGRLTSVTQPEKCWTHRGRRTGCGCSTRRIRFRWCGPWWGWCRTWKLGAGQCGSGWIIRIGRTRRPVLVWDSVLIAAVSGRT